MYIEREGETLDVLQQRLGGRLGRGLDVRRLPALGLGGDL